MTQATEQPPAVRRGPHCEALEGFLGEWKAKGSPAEDQTRGRRRLESFPTSSRPKP